MRIVLYKPTKEKINLTTPDQAGFNFKRTECLKLIRNLQFMYQRNRGSAKMVTCNFVVLYFRAWSMITKIHGLDGKRRYH